MSKPKLSVTIVTLNEEVNLPRCLDSIKEIADDIVVVDSGSTDETVKIVKKFGARVFERKFDDYSSQKNFAAQKAFGDWILSLDADEIISPKLAEEIRSKVKSPRKASQRGKQKSNVNAYSMPRKNIIFGKFIKYTRWQPELDRHVWLWKKGKGRWTGGVHEEVKVDGEVGSLKNAKIHHQYNTVSEFMKMMNRYSELDAKQIVKRDVKFSYLRLFLDPTYNFLVRYFYRLGFLDGWRGFVLSYLMLLYHIELWIKIWESQHK